MEFRFDLGELIFGRAHDEADGFADVRFLDGRAGFEKLAERGQALGLEFGIEKPRLQRVEKTVGIAEINGGEKRS